MQKKLILPTFIMGSLFIFSSPLMAAIQYMPDVRNCSVTRLAPDLWRAKFDYAISQSSGSKDGTDDNTFYFFVPQLASNGLPATGSNQPRAVVNWSNLTHGANLLSKVSSTGISFGGSNKATPNVIYAGSTVSVDFNTKGNNAYPILSGWYNNNLGAGGGQSKHFWVTQAGCSLSNALPPGLPPIDQINPPEPEFKLNSAKWELDTVDVGDLPDAAIAGNGYRASIKNIAGNNFCINYVTTGVKNNSYALSVTNASRMLGGRSLFTLQGSGSELFYNLQLASNNGVTANDYSFPAASAKYITLTQTASSVAGRSEMCWAPKINLFKNASTKEGMHTGTMNFVISPRA